MSFETTEIKYSTV